MSVLQKLKKAFSINTPEMDRGKVFYRVGGTGTKLSNGWLFEEYNDKLKDRKQRYDTYLQMDNDSTVFELRNAINLAKLSTNFFVEPFQDGEGNSNERDYMIASFVEEAMFKRLNQGWRQFVEEMSLYVRDGFSLFELYFEKDKRGYRPQMQRMTCDTIHKWEQSNGEPGIQQLLYYTKESESEENNLNQGKGNIDIPSNKLLLFNINAEGQNYEGQGLYRKIVKDRFIKDKLENYHATFQERFAIPPIKLKMPFGSEPSKVEEYGEIAENVRSHEQGYVTSFVSDEGTPIVDYEFMNNPSNTDTKLLDGIRHYQQNIVDVFFGQFMYLGKSEKGSYGMASTSMNFYFQGIKSLLEKDMEILNRYLVPKIVAMNFGETERLPKIDFGQVGFIDTKSFSETISQLYEKNIISCNYETEKYVRELLNLPAITEDEREEIQEKKKMMPTPTPGQQEAKKIEKEEIDDEDEEMEEEMKAHAPNCGCEFHNLDQDLINAFSHDLIVNAQVKDEVSNPKSYKRDFADPTTDEYRRPLTFAERKVNISSIKSNIKKEEENLQQKYSEIVNKQTSEILDQVDKIVKNNDTKAINDIKVSGGIDKAVVSSYKSMFDIGKNEASREIGVEIPKTKKEVSQIISVQAQNISNQLNQKAEAEVKNILSTQITQRGGISDTSNVEMVSTIKKNLSSFYDNAFKTISTIAVAQSLNSGRKSVADINAKMIYGSQYSAIVDEVTSIRCLSLDGRVVKVGSPDYSNFSPPQHTNCRSMWVFINEDEDFKPEVNTIPNTIPAKDTINGKDGLKAPVLEKSSPAIKQIEQEIEWRKSKLATQTGKVQAKNQEIIYRLQKSLDNVS